MIKNIFNLKLGPGFQNLLEKWNYSSKNLSISHVVQRNGHYQSYALIRNFKINKDAFEIMAIIDSSTASKEDENSKKVDMSKSLLVQIYDQIKNISCDNFGDFSKLGVEVSKVIKEINDKMISEDEYKKYLPASLALAIIGKDKTLVLNIGDTTIKMLTKDNIVITPVQNDIHVNKINISDDCRGFHAFSLITDKRLISKSTDTDNFHMRVMDTSLIDKLILYSRGIFRCLSKETMDHFMKKCNGEDIARNLTHFSSNFKFHLHNSSGGIVDTIYPAETDLVVGVYKSKKR